MVGYRRNNGGCRLLVITKNQPNILIVDIANTDIDKIPKVLDGYIDVKDIVEFVVVLS
jgi:hypothetical protein